MINYSVKVFPFQSNSKVVAYATLVIEDVVEISGFKIINGAKGLFVGPPQKKGKDKKTGEEKWYDDIRFLEEVPEGQYRGPLAEEIYRAMIDTYQEKAQGNARGSAAGAQTRTPRPTGSRPSTESSDPFGDSDVGW